MHCDCGVSGQFDNQIQQRTLYVSSFLSAIRIHIHSWNFKNNTSMYMCCTAIGLRYPILVNCQGDRTTEAIMAFRWSTDYIDPKSIRLQLLWLTFQFGMLTRMLMWEHKGFNLWFESQQTHKIIYVFLRFCRLFSFFCQCQSVCLMRWERIT